MTSLRWIDEFVSLKCGPLVMPLFPNAKEIMESMSAFGHIRNIMVDEFKNDKISCLVVGDGNTPRTGALFACRTKWNVISVDPQMKNKETNIQRLSVIKDKVENIDSIDAETGVIIAVHSHAKLQNAVDKFKNYKRLVIFAMPCCFKQEVENRRPIFKGFDNAVSGPKNEVLIWDWRN